MTTRLSLRKPALCGVAIVAVVAAGLGIAARTPFERSIGLTGHVVAEPGSRPVRLGRDGILERVHVAIGQQVAAGQIIVSFDTGPMAAELAELRRQADTAERQLEEIRKEVAAIIAGGELRAETRARIAALEGRIVAIEKDGVALTRRTAIAEQELARAAIRAPVAGRLTHVATLEAGAALTAGTTVAEIAPLTPPVAIITTLDASRGIAAGTPVRVWPIDTDAAGFRPLRARVTGVAAVPHVASEHALKIELAGGRTAQLAPGSQVRLGIATGTHTFLGELIEPVVRLLNRASRA